jgi:methyltransferase (TIGR00027 family)
VQEGRASRTAEHNALFRALESCRARRDQLIDDPLAAGFVTWPLSLAYRVGRVPGLGRFIPWFIDRRWPGTRTSVVARTRLIDAAIAAVLDEGVEQVVVLGAGFDSRAYRMGRLDGRSGVAVFEVDHPSTQAEKRRRLERMPGVVSDHVRFVATDFTEKGLREAMEAAGYREDARTLILWEGVTNYLTEEAVSTTLRWCARAAPGSTLIFTYVHRDIITSPEKFVGSDHLFAALDRAGERFTFGIHPDELAGFLARHGLRLESDVGAVEYRERAYGEAGRRMRGHEFYRVAQARVTEEAMRSV